MTLTTFDTSKSGDTVYRATISGGGLTAHILTHGATLQDLRLEGYKPPLVLGFETLEAYTTYGRYVGATVGRFANRIAGGQFTVDGISYQADRNYVNRHSLHGGNNGLDQRNWTITHHSLHSLRLEVSDEDGNNGFPGNTHHICTYTLEIDGTLSIALSTTTDAPTIASLTNHSYFNLDDGKDCLDHIFHIRSNHVLAVNDDLIPIGSLTPVEGLPLDLRAPTDIRAVVESGTLFDCNYCLADKRRALTKVATATSPQSGITLTVSTTEPGLQFYAGHHLDTPADGVENRAYGHCAGFAFESQIWPDAPNHAAFPNAVLRPGETLNQHTRYRFTR